VRRDRVRLPPERRLERLEPVSWLRRELAAAEQLLLAEYERCAAVCRRLAGGCRPPALTALTTRTARRPALTELSVGPPRMAV